MVTVQHTWMSFVDGENFTIRGQELAESRGVGLLEGRWYKRDCFLWMPRWRAGSRPAGHYMTLQGSAIRASYYTSVQGDDVALREVTERLWDLGFNPCVFKKQDRTRKAKGVDIALTKDILSHAFLGNYQAVVLVAGDGDYIPLVDEVKRLGKRVILWFFESEGLSRELRLRCDRFFDLTDSFLSHWRTKPNAPLSQ